MTTDLNVPTQPKSTDEEPATNHEDNPIPVVEEGPVFDPAVDA